ncbi:MAG: hypothetical protein ACJAX5_001087 [Patiriisocius sp.]|jgi:hypothetical protein
MMNATNDPTSDPVKASGKGEENLQRLILTMKPELVSGAFAFFCVSEADLARFSSADIKVMVREAEGITVVLACDVAARYELAVTNRFACITLQVHSSLDAVGLTAVVASQLAMSGISANVVAGYYHDHIYVAEADGPQAIELLASLKPGVIDKYLGAGF